jgi:transcriptional regulator with XRE-family HTH domain
LNLQISLDGDPMPSHSSPTVKRRRLAAELRRRRDEAGMTIEEVADQLEWSAAKISRIENSRVSVLPRDVKFLLRTYGAEEGTEEWEALLVLSRESRQKGWWNAHGDAIPEWFATYVGLEADATTMRTYESEVVPGLLQTEDYARAVHEATMLTATEEEIEKQVAVRMARQDRLTAANTPQIWVVINEAVIRRIVGGAEVMCAQLVALAEASGRPNLTLQVLPFSVGAHAGMDGAFMILGFPEPTDPDVVYVHYYAGTLYLEKPQESERYTLMFDHLRAAALPVSQSRDLIVRVADELA